MTIGKTIVLTRWTFVGKVMSLLFNMLSRLVKAFLLGSKHLFISWLQSPTEVTLESKKIKSVTVSIASPPICHIVSNSVWPCGLQSARALCPWDSLDKSARVSCHACLQRTFLTQQWNPCLLHCRQILYHSPLGKPAEVDGSCKLQTFLCIFRFSFFKSDD